MTADTLANSYLEHHGIKGMKWGIRRYQNYDGTYTQAGLRRYRTAESNYSDAAAAYKEIKRNKKGSDPVSVESARIDRDKKKLALSKAYDDVREGKRIDKGRRLYAQGHTITENNKFPSKKILKGLGTSVAVGAFLVKNGYIALDKKQTIAALGAAGAASIAVGAKVAKDSHDNKLMQAYWWRDRNKFPAELERPKK